MDIDYYLISAAHRAHRLRTGRAYVFGREAGVDIVVTDAMVSRRHAEVRWQDDGWVAADLGSRNGVLVNGSRLQAPCLLQDGDQVQVGGQVFRFHVLPPGADPASLSHQAPQISSVETMGPSYSLSELAEQGAAFTGVISDGVLEMLQFFHVTRKSGRLDLMGGSALASIWIEQGTPVHAVCAEETGVEALIAACLRPPPRFAFHEHAMIEERSLNGSAQGLFMEIARRMDETNRPA